MKKKSKKYLEMPENFVGFSYKEVKIRRAMLELKRDALKQRMVNSVNEIKRSAMPQREKPSKMGKLLSLIGLGGSAVSSGKVGVAVKVATVGLEAFKIIKKIKDKRQAKRQNI